MGDFTIRFFLCNLCISGIIGIFLLIRQIFRRTMPCRMQYHLWFLLLGLLAVPFVPFRPVRFRWISLWFAGLKTSSSLQAGTAAGKTISAHTTEAANWMQDFAVSVSRSTPSLAGQILGAIWITGIFVMLLFLLHASLRLHRIKKSALLLQNPDIQTLYCHCLKEMNLTRHIPVYSTPYLTSPSLAGCINPCIFLPLSLISDHSRSELRYILLHELQHYKHRDTLAGYLMHAVKALYWFNPLVWYALKQMRDDREIACDTSVLQMLDENAYEAYGNALINFAEKMSLSPFPFTAGMGGNQKQIKRRILNVISYEKPTRSKKQKGFAVFLLTAILLFVFAPLLSTYAADAGRYPWDTTGETISYADLSDYFAGYEGSFVLYDLTGDAWSIYNMDRAALRAAPDSTYKIYDALFHLDAGDITPEHSLLSWDQQEYPFASWNTDQTLTSAMRLSVNWYFQRLDAWLGKDKLNAYLHRIGYGNETMSDDLSAYWMESSLKISPIEQVRLLTALYRNEWDFAPEHIAAVKDALYLSRSGSSILYGKTGTGCVNGENVNGWFVGYVEQKENTYFFAVNLSADQDADGSHASETALKILSDLNILKQ